MKGIILFYINFFPDLGQELTKTVQLVLNQNSALFQKIRSQYYEVLVVPCTKEGTRIEKCDFDKPFPIFSPDKQGFDLYDMEFVEGPAIPNRKRGILTLFLNFWPEHQTDIEVYIKEFKEVNSIFFDKVETECPYDFMIVPCTKEGTRVEKMEYDKPFPRFVTLPKEFLEKYLSLKLLPGLKKADVEEDNNG